MEDQTFLKKRWRAIFKAGLWGACVFTAFTLAVKAGAHFWMHGYSGELRPDLFLGLSFVIAAPAFWLFRAFGIDPTHIAGFLNSFIFVCMVNGFCGAILFSIIASLWQFTIKEQNKGH